MKVYVAIYEEDVEGDYGMVAGIRLTCNRCGHQTDVRGTSEASANHGASVLRADCPRGERNFYDVGGWF